MMESPTNCPISSELKAWLDGELLPHRAAAVSEHVNACAMCRDLSADFRRLSSVIGSASAGSAPQAVDAYALLEHAKSRRKNEDALVRFLKGIAASAAAVLIVSTALSISRTSAGRDESAISAGGASSLTVTGDSTAASLDPESPYVVGPSGSGSPLAESPEFWRP